MRELTWWSMVLVAVGGCVGNDDSGGRVVYLGPDACATDVVPPDAGADAPVAPTLCGIASPGVLTLGQSVSGTTVGATNAHTPACGFGVSPEVAYSFVAPAAGVYAFDTAGSTFDTVLELLDPASCGTLACVDDAPSSSLARVVMQLAAGQEVVLVVEGWDGLQGNYVLGAALQPVCAPQVVTGPLPSETTVTLTGTSRWSSACGGSGPEAAFSYTIPADGYYTFDTIGSTVDTLLYVRGDCNQAEYACDNDSAGGGAAMLGNYLYAGSTFEFVVDTNASGGTVRFNVTGPPPPPPPPACPETSIGSASPQTITGSTAGAAAALSGTCGGAGPEKTYVFTAPSAGVFRFDTAGSQGDTVVYVRNGSCAGAELACNDDYSGLSSLVEVQLAQNQTVVIVVDSFNGAGAPYTLNVSGPI